MKTFPHKKWNPFIQLDYHAGIFMTGPIPVPGKAWHLGAGILAMPWIYLGTAKNNGDTIFADGMPVVSRGHEPKYAIIPHWNMFPFFPVQPNILMPLLVLKSSNKCQFAVGSVVGKDGPIAVSIFKYVGINQACNDPCSAPTSLVANWGSVELGFTWGDLLATVLNIAFDSLKSFLEGKLFESLGKLIPKGLFKNQMKSLLGRLGLPKIYRNTLGQFASMSETLVSDTITALSSTLYGELFGGNLGATLGNPDPISAISNAASSGADKLGAWIDGRSEAFGD